MTQRYGVETEADKCISTVALTVAKCRVKLYEGACNEDECAQCETRAKAMHVYNSFSDADQLAIDNKVEQLLNDHAEHKAKVEYNRQVQREYAIAPVAVGIIFIVLFTLMILTCGAAYPVKSLDTYQRYRFKDEPLYKEEYRKAIYDTLLETDRLISDINNDNDINCQDWSVLFYKIFRDSYPRFHVALVINDNQSTGMCHMFIAVRYSSLSEWEYIEPQAFKNGECNRSYFMEDYWGKMYNPLYNIISTDYLYNKYFIQKRKV